MQVGPTHALVGAMGVGFLNAARPGAVEHDRHPGGDGLAEFGAGVFTKECGEGAGDDGVEFGFDVSGRFVGGDAAVEADGDTVGDDVGVDAALDQADGQLRRADAGGFGDAVRQA